mmetsp:Transcript_14842/g.30294  ORF Transcript_14842/g.30294 Transcript_14842/m.30294 type:complete len:295 (+) Transcript_14842:163-1047(+)
MVKENCTDSIAVDHLPEAEYTKCFTEYKKITNEYDAMMKLSKQAFSEWSGVKGKGRVLSIGPGTGDFDFALFDMLDWQPSFYAAVEPNEVFARELKGRCHQMFGDNGNETGSFRILSDLFTTTTPDLSGETEHEKFDIILLVHCYYHLHPAADIMKRCRDRLLAPGGKAMIYIQTEGIVTQLCSEFHPRWTFSKSLAGSEDYLVTDESLLAEFGRQVGDGMQYEGLRAPSEVFMKDIWQDNEKVQSIFSFILQTNVDKLSESEQNNIHSYVKTLLREDMSLAHDSALVIAKRDD